MLYANRDRDSVIFGPELDRLARAHPDRFDLRHHHDLDRGFLDREAITEFLGPDLEVDVYICGPGPFMDLVEGTLLDLGVDPGDIFIERFTVASAAPASDAVEEPVSVDQPGTEGSSEVAGAEIPETVVIILKGRKHPIAYHAGDTVLETARRGNVPAPSSCEAGSCATCMALVREGSARMRVNNALDPRRGRGGVGPDLPEPAHQLDLRRRVRTDVRGRLDRETEEG